MSDADDVGAVLIYDGDCPFCSAAATALRRTRDVGVVPWAADPAQALLAAQFEEAPFALALVDRDAGAVWLGRAAARELCDRAGVPALVADLVSDNYESVADAVRAVAGGDREPDPYHGRFDLAAAARERYPALAAAAERPRVTLSGRE